MSNKASLPLSTATAPRLRILHLNSELAEKIRTSRIDAFGGKVESRIDSGQHQCRVCLELTRANEEYLLFTHSPFKKLSPYAERGPIFVHARTCAPYTDTGTFPVCFPRDIVLRAYDKEGVIVDAQLSGGDDLEQIAEALLNNPSVTFLHARNRTFGCFMYQVEKRTG